MKDDELLHKWINGTITVEELEIFKLRPEYDSLVVLYKNTEQLSVPGFEGKEMLQEILSQEKTEERKETEEKKVDKSKRRFLSNWVKYAAAASVLLLVAFFFWPKNNPVVTFNIAKGEKKEGTLPDQSTFILNAESTLSYNKNTWESSRSLDLNGEAFFNVKKGATFKVNTPNGNVQVLGTQFNVRSRVEGLEVKCKSGKVAVLSSEGKVFGELESNDAILIIRNRVANQWQFQDSDNISWISGISKFKRARLEVVLAELERQFDVKIIKNAVNYKAIVSCNFQHKDLDLALKTSLSALGIKYEISEGNVITLNR